MTKLYLVGIGTGNPHHVTYEAVSQLRQADIIIVPRKGSAKSDLADLRHQICDRLLGDDCPPIIEFDLPVRDDNKTYFDAVDEWHDAIAVIWQKTIEGAEAIIGRIPQSVGLLIWGDPSLYDSSLRIAARLNPMPQITVIPGITSIQALTAAHKIPVNELGAPFMITTGRQLRDKGFPENTNTIIILLDGHCAFQTLDKERYYIYWGAYLGMPNQILHAGPLDEMSDKIIATRQQARKEHGWIMDSYLLRRLK